MIEAALAAARATAEAEEAAALATRLSDAADRYERDAADEQQPAHKPEDPGAWPPVPLECKQVDRSWLNVRHEEGCERAPGATCQPWAAGRP